MRKPAPLVADWADRPPRMAAITAPQGRISPVWVMVCERSGSYSVSTEPCVNRSVAPWLAGWSGLPSIFVGRPSWLSTNTPLATPPSDIAVAKNNGLPGISSSGWRTYGTIISVGCTVQAVTPASAIDALINFMNDRRPTGSSHSDALVGNSRCRYSLNSVVSATASRLRHTCGPPCCSSRARTAWMSIGALIERCAFGSVSSACIGFIGGIPSN